VNQILKYPLRRTKEKQTGDWLLRRTMTTSAIFAVNFYWKPISVTFVSPFHKKHLQIHLITWIATCAQLAGRVLKSRDLRLTLNLYKDEMECN
jgi:hypothetical protein